MSKERIEGVPAPKLEKTVKRAREAGATRIVITKNPDGTFDVVVTIP